jgi:membrane fusion protein
MSLFRTEAIEHQRRDLYGQVTIHQPTSFLVYTAVAAAGALTVVIFLTTGVFARKETVLGWIAPEHGMAQVHAQRGGTATRVFVGEGDTVQAGAPLASFSLDASGSEGGLATRSRSQLSARTGELDLQMVQALQGRNLEARGLRERARALRGEAEQLQTQRSLQLQQLKITERQLARARTLSEKGYVTAVDIDQREQALLNQQQAIVELGRQIAVKMADAAEAQNQAQSVDSQAAMEASQLRAAKAVLVQSMAELDVQTSDVIRAPVSGEIAYVNVHTGEMVSAAVPLFAISPKGDNLQAELLVPTRAAGFIAKGQVVRLMIDAFPYQHYGAINGHVAEISRAVLNPGQIAAPFEQKDAAYRVLVRVPAPPQRAYGGPAPLRAGMTLKADIITERRTFFQWLFEPLLAAQKRAT